MQAEAASPQLGWNLVDDVREVLEYHFMVNALLAGTVVALIAGLVGWVMVVRRQVFAGHTLAMMAFPGASSAALLGVPGACGYAVWCGAGAGAISLSSPATRSWGERSAGTGAVQSLALAAGFLFVSLYGGVLADLESVLFGNVLGVSDSQLLVLSLVAAALLLALAVLARPLLFASLDPEVAAARGVPVRGLSLAFLALLAVTVAATSQITGVLLVFSLLVAPPAAAQALTARPALSLALSVALALLITWLGLAVSYFSIYPAGFFISTFAFAVYLLARLAALLRARGLVRRPRRPLALGAGVS